MSILSEDRLLTLVNGMHRQDIIEWLSWNEPNGIYNNLYLWLIFSINRGPRWGRKAKTSYIIEKFFCSSTHTDDILT
jgi:hypothetical protein